ncbi:MAG: hypothetical protein ABSB40_04530 [Nitrososphaeria archaeon]|jgi:hypothetical protein
MTDKTKGPKREVLLRMVEFVASVLYIIDFLVSHKVPNYLSLELGSGLGNALSIGIFILAWIGVIVIGGLSAIVRLVRKLTVTKKPKSVAPSPSISPIPKEVAKESVSEELNKVKTKPFQEAHLTKIPKETTEAEIKKHYHDVAQSYFVLLSRMNLSDMEGSVAYRQLGGNLNVIPREGFEQVEAHLKSDIPDFFTNLSKIEMEIKDLNKEPLVIEALVKEKATTALSQIAPIAKIPNKNWLLDPCRYMSEIDNSELQAISTWLSSPSIFITPVLEILRDCYIKIFYIRRFKGEPEYKILQDMQLPNSFIVHGDINRSIALYSTPDVDAKVPLGKALSAQQKESVVKTLNSLLTDSKIREKIDAAINRKKKIFDEVATLREKIQVILNRIEKGEGGAYDTRVECCKKILESSV